jgi:hypothetical protein
MPWDYEVDELSSLCEPCHDLATKKDTQFDELIYTLKAYPEARSRVVGYVCACLVSSGAPWPTSVRTDDKHVIEAIADGFHVSSERVEVAMVDGAIQLGKLLER